MELITSGLSGLSALPGCAQFGFNLKYCKTWEELSSLSVLTEVATGGVL